MHYRIQPLQPSPVPRRKKWGANVIKETTPSLPNLSAPLAVPRLTDIDLLFVILQMSRAELFGFDAM